MITVRAGSVYFAIAFAAGFVLGAIRVILVAPAVGVLAAVLIELPIMLAICWLASGWTVRRFAVPATGAERLTMGLVAFVLLMIAEFALAAYAFGLPPSEYARDLATPHGLLGLVGQVAFGLFPWLRLYLVGKP